MSSPAQLTANLANSSQSTGPVTAEGKSVSSMNSFKHGLTSAKLFLPGEDPAHYQALHADYIARYAPETTFEYTLVDNLVNACWRAQRIAELEDAFLQSRIDAIMEAHPEMTPMRAHAHIFGDKQESDRLRLYLRYQTSASRAYYRALAEVDKMVKDRNRRRLEESAFLAPQPPVSNGFVSQNAEEPSPASGPQPQLSRQQRRAAARELAKELSRASRAAA